MSVELPEALILAGQMNEALVGKKVKKAGVSDELAKMARLGFVRFEGEGYDWKARPLTEVFRFMEDRLSGRKVVETYARGKMVFVRLDGGLFLLLMPETGGRILFIEKAGKPERHHLRLDFDDGTALFARYKGMGFIHVVTEDALPGHWYVRGLGLSPVGEGFTFEKFDRFLESRSGENLKSIFTTRGKANIDGIGNGYFQEIAFRAKLHPKAKARDLTKEGRRTLYESVKGVLAEALEKGGKEEFVDLYGNPGRYRKTMGSHALGQPCPDCGARIERTNIAGSQTYYCPSCQRL